jgi:alpha-L-arabinofuranosidase
MNLRRGSVALWLSLLPLAATAQPPLQASVSVRPEQVAGPVDPLLYGQFAEFMFENIKGGMYAELVRDRSFEEAPNVIGLPRHWERDPDDRNDDDRINFAWDSQSMYPPATSGEHALKIELKTLDGQRRGLRQSGVPVRAGFRYHGYLWARAPQLDGGRIRVALEADQTDGQRYAVADLGAVSGDWKQYHFSMVSGHSDPLAKLAILVEGKGTLWIDQVSLLPGDAVDGVRADVLNRIRPLKPAFVRWPGGNVAQDYFWTWGVGPRDQRKTWANLAWRNEPEPSDFGTDEYLKFCRNVGATPTLTVNVEGRGATPQLAADWVEYCNGPVTSKFGAMRAANGHPQPYNVKIWEIGNEIWGSWVRGHSDATTYGNNFLRYAEAMKKVDPSLSFIAVGDNDMTWNRTVLSIIGSKADYLAVHHYYGPAEMKGDKTNLMARPLVYGRFYDELGKLLPQGMKLAINEWNTTLPMPRQHSMESAVYGARLMNVFLRSKGLVAMSCVSDLVNGWSGGIIQASRHGVFVTPSYHVNAMYAQAAPARVVQAEVSSPTVDTSLEGKAVPVLDAVVTASQNGELRMHAVNTDLSRSVQVRVQGARPVEMTLLASAPGAFNNFAKPAEVAPKRVPLGGSELNLPPQSVAVVKLAK